MSKMAFLSHHRALSFTIPLNYPRYWVLTLVSLCISPVLGEIYEFKLRLPQPKSMEISHSMTISGSPQSLGEIAVAEDLMLRSRTNGPEGLQVVFIKAEDFQRIDRSHFCCTEDESQHSPSSCPDSRSVKHAAHNVRGPNDVSGKDSFIYATKVSDAATLVGEGSSENHPDYSARNGENGEKKISSFPVSSTSMYYIGITNCGTQHFDEMSDFLEGKILARSSHGYLPAVDAPALLFNEFLLGVYFIMLLVWSYYIFIKNRNHIVTLHVLLLILIGVTFVCTLARYSVYSVSNITEIETGNSEVLAELLQSVKFAAAMLTGVVICQGYGITNDSLGARRFFYLFIYGLIYCGLACFRILILWNYDFSSNMITTGSSVLDHLANLGAIVIVPEAFVFAYLCNAGMRSLSELKISLVESKQIESLKTITSFALLVYSSCVSVAGLLILQVIVEISTDIHQRWHFLWFFDEGAPNLIFCFLVVSLLYLFWPTSNYRQKCSSMQIHSEDITGEIELGHVGPEIIGDVKERKGGETYLE